MSNPSPPAGLENYPGYFPPRSTSWYRRTWLLVVVTAVLAFVLGTMVSGAEPAVAEQTDVPSATEDGGAEASRLREQLDAQESDMVQLKNELARAESDSATKIDQIRARAAKARKAAVREATSVVRARAAKRQQQAVAAAVADTEARMAASAPAPAPSGGSGGTDPRYGACYEANAAGYGEYVRGVDPEYDWYDDRDGDGIVCEF